MQKLFAAVVMATFTLSASDLTGKWIGTLTTMSRLGTMKARVDVTREPGSTPGRDLTGKWTGSFDKIGPSGRITPARAYMELKQSGAQITGTVGSSEAEQVKILRGNIYGNRISFEAPHPPSGPLMRFDLVYEGDHLKGNVNMEPDVEAKTKEQRFYANLRQSGAEITGTAGPNEDQQWPIQKGKIDGGKVTFEIDIVKTRASSAVHLADDHIEGDANIEHIEHDGHVVKAKHPTDGSNSSCRGGHLGGGDGALLVSYDVRSRN
jgi:hypothetical protein